MLKHLTAAALATCAMTTLAQAGNFYVEAADTYCQKAISGSLSEDTGLSPVKDPKDIPPVFKVYEGKLDGEPVELILGKPNGPTHCVVHFASATLDDYKKVDAIYRDRFGVEGIINDSHKDMGYSAESWEDSEAMNGQVEDMKVGTTPLADTLVQFSEKPFNLTANRTGLIVSMTGR